MVVSKKTRDKTQGAANGANGAKKKSLADLIQEVSSEDYKETGVLDFLMRRRDQILLVLSKNVPGSTLYETLTGEGLDCTYPHFMRQIRQFCIINELPVRGRVEESERERANAVNRRYQMMQKAGERIAGRTPSLEPAPSVAVAAEQASHDSKRGKTHLLAQPSIGDRPI